MTTNSTVGRTNVVVYLFRQSWPLLIFASLTGSIAGLSSAAVISTISKGVVNRTDMSQLGLVFFGLCIAMLIGKSCSELTLLNITQDAIFRLRIDLSKKLLATPLRRLQSIGHDGLFVILTRDIEAFVQAFQHLPTSFANSIVLISCLVYLTYTSWELVAVLLVCLCFGVVAFQMAEHFPRRYMLKSRDQMSSLYRNFRTLVEGAKELQLNRKHGENFICKVITPGMKEVRHSYTRYIIGYTWIMNVGTVAFFCIIGLLLFVVPRFVPTQPEVVSTFALVMLYLIRPITELMTALPAVRQATISLNKIKQLEGALTEFQPQLPHKDMFAKQGKLKLELRGVCHEYKRATDDHCFLLGPIDLTLSEGEIVFIVGGNGSGKTTLALMLLGLHLPEQGEIILNGVQLNCENVDAYRSHFSAVFADFHLFEQLLQIDHPGVETEAERYIRLLGMDQKVKIKHGAFSTTNLSTGQRKRLALVGAYIENRSVYLFDEWAADQDPEFKKTVIAITHDDSYFSCADRIIKLEDGRLVQVDQQHQVFANLRTDAA
jgi:putative ATP-binding cassette transporter